jgi:hypothetical protein
VAVDHAEHVKGIISKRKVDDALPVCEAPDAGAKLVATDAGKAKRCERTDLPIKINNEIVRGLWVLGRDIAMIVVEIGSRCRRPDQSPAPNGRPPSPCDPRDASA